MSYKKSCIISGGRPVRGEITCLGAKNFATKAMVAAILGDSPSVLTNVPAIGDVDITADMLRSVGVALHTQGLTMSIDPANLQSPQVAKSKLGSNRLPILMMAALLNRFETVEVPSQGGCSIGPRPVDFHVMAMQAFGAKVEDDGHIMRASRVGPLKGAHIRLPFPSVGATETCLLLSVLAHGRSVFANVATEPEIMALITMLNLMGAAIYYGPNREITVDGVKQLNGTQMPCLGDRIEAASMACLACASNGSILVKGVRPDIMTNFLPHFRRIGGGFELVGPEEMRFFRASPLRATVLEMGVYPGFSTDWQQPFAALLTQAEGISAIHETIWENRFGFLGTLNKLGARTQVTCECLGAPCKFKDLGHPHSAMIWGRTPLEAIAEPIQVPDLRAGLAYVVAAAIAKGTTTLTHLELIERGYGDIVSRLGNLNLDIMSASVQPSKMLVKEKEQVLV